MERSKFDECLKELNLKEGDIICLTTSLGIDEWITRFYKFVKLFSGYVVVSLQTISKRGHMPEEYLSGFTHEQVEYASIISRSVTSYE